MGESNHNLKARDLILTTLQDRDCLVRFAIPGAHVSEDLVTGVFRAIVNSEISIIYDRSLRTAGGGNKAFYDWQNNTFSIGFDTLEEGLDARVRQQSLILHECIHAGHDIQAGAHRSVGRMRRGTAEAAAYLAQGIYIRRKLGNNFSPRTRFGALLLELSDQVIAGRALSARQVDRFIGLLWQNPAYSCTNASHRIGFDGLQ